MKWIPGDAFSMGSSEFYGKRSFFRAVVDGRYKFVRWFSREEYANLDARVVFGGLGQRQKRLEGILKALLQGVVGDVGGEPGELLVQRVCAQRGASSGNVVPILQLIRQGWSDTQVSPSS